jgi:predicted metal-binding protein|tara:strand:- start:22 stop:291 length:270 start_codon:yes stop_codon:yes gene_type:complete
MTLKKQSIRANQTIYLDDNKDPSTKEELIKLSEEWSEYQVKFFKKMLKQGGEFKVKGNKFKVTVAERTDIDSAGNKPVTVPPLPGERTF